MYKVEISDTVNKVIFDENSQELVLKAQDIIDLEQLNLINDKTAEIQAQVNAYQIKQQHQLQHGGAGPVAEVEIMKIVNEHAGQFEVIFKQD